MANEWARECLKNRVQNGNHSQKATCRFGNSRAAVVHKLNFYGPHNLN